MARSHARNLLVRSPLRHLYRGLLVPANDASWIFDGAHLAWTSEAELVDQLPPAYRRLAAFYALQSRLRPGPILGGQRAFELARWIHERLGGEESVRLVVGSTVTHLRLSDMRMLHVPNELRTAEGDAAVVDHWLRPGDSFVDVGANHGSFSIRAGVIVGPSGMVVAVEPQPWLAELVERSLSANGGPPHLVLRQAMGDRDGEIRLMVPRTSSGSASAHGAERDASSSVETRAKLGRLDESFDWRALPGEVLLKIDVEGAEFAVLLGATEFLRARRPRIVMEINPRSLETAGVSLPDCVRFLEAHGYEAFADPLRPESRRPLRDLSAETHRNVLLLPGPHHVG